MTGKLCEENGFSYEWSMPKNTVDLTLVGVLMQCVEFVPSSCSWIVIKFLYQLVFYIATAGLIKSSPAIERSHEQALVYWCDSTKSQNQKQKVEQQAGNGRPSSRPSGKVRGVHRQSRGHTRVLPAHVSHDSGSECPTKMVSTSRKHSIYTHFTKTELRSMLVNHDDKCSLQKAHW